MCRMRATISAMRRLASLACLAHSVSREPAGRRFASRSRKPTTLVSGLLISWAAALASSVTDFSAAVSRSAASRRSRSTTSTKSRAASQMPTASARSSSHHCLAKSRQPRGPSGRNEAAVSA